MGVDGSYPVQGGATPTPLVEPVVPPRPGPNIHVLQTWGFPRETSTVIFTHFPSVCWVLVTETRSRTKTRVKELSLAGAEVGVGRGTGGAGRAGM